MRSIMSGGYIGVEERSYASKIEKTQFLPLLDHVIKYCINDIIRMEGGDKNEDSERSENQIFSQHSSSN